MKYILSLIIGGALVVSGFGQTRNVLVGTNNTVVQPTNFWSADAANARTGLGLGTAATNPATAFQPASSVLTNLANNNGSSLTNINISSIGTIAITNISGLQSALDGKLATNGSAANLTSFPSSILQTNSDITNFPSGLLRTNGSALELTNFPVIPVTSGGTGGTNAATARSGIGLGTGDTLTVAGLVSDSLTINSGGGIILQSALNNAGAFRTNIGLPWSGLTSASAATFRTALELGSASTNPSTAFQPSSSVLTNLASGNGGSLTNLQATSLIGTIPASNISTVNFTNIGGTLLITSGGTGATNASDARQNLGATTVGDAVFTATNAAAARTAINALATNGNGAGLTNLTAANITGSVAIANGGTGATNAATARTNLGLGWSALTNTDATNFRNAIALGTTNNVVFGSIASGSDTGINGSYIEFGGTDVINTEELRLIGNWQVEGSFGFNGTNIPLFQAQSRTNFGLPWSGLTNTNAATFQAALFGTNTNPVLVNTNGEVVSPTNFWQAAPITTTFVESQPTTNSTTNITAARFLHIHSLNTNIFNVTNTIALPTNGSTFNGDIALVVHQGPTNSMTRVRSVGSTNDIVTMTRYNEAIEFVYYNNAWQFNHNETFTEPIYFSGTNAVTHAAESRTNLGLGATWLTNTNVTNFRTAIGLGTTNEPTFETVFAQQLSAQLIQTVSDTNSTALSPTGIEFAGISAATTRTNLGLGATWLTNTDASNFRTAIGLGATNNVAFRNITSDGNIVISNQSATNNGILFVYRTNNEPFLGLANLIASNNTTVSNETLFRVGVAEATNKSAQFGFRSTNTNGDGVAVFSMYGYNALMMIGPSARSATNTNGIEADIWSISPTNRVATLIDTNTGAFTLHRSIGFDTNVSSVGNTNLVPATNNQISKWLRVYIGTNTFYLPLYQ